MRLLATLLMLASTEVSSDTVVMNNTVRAHQVITNNDVRIVEGVIHGAAQDLSEVVGYETRHALYRGRPVMLNAVTTPAIVFKNQIVSLLYKSGGLIIATDGRALNRGSIGDRISVMNIKSRTILLGSITKDGTVIVNQ